MHSHKKYLIWEGVTYLPLTTGIQLLKAPPEKQRVIGRYQEGSALTSEDLIDQNPD
jgi:hypothetical protein